MGISLSARVVSRNNFPMGAGIASSASGFAALTVAAAAALRMTLTERELSALARRGSGSASRSIPEGFAEWHVADTDAGSYAESIAPADHWELTDLIAVVSAEHKKFPSSEGNRLAESSPLQNARLTDTVRRLDICREALHKKEFATFASIVEEDTLLMHAVMMTSSPSLVYFEGTTLEILRKVPSWRRQGLNVCFSVDAGPNVHCICLSRDAEEVKLRLRGMPQVQQVICAVPGPAAHLCEIEREELV